MGVVNNGEFTAERPSRERHNGMRYSGVQEEVAAEEIHLISFEQREPWKLDATVES
jgi:hypothetical protein